MPSSRTLRLQPVSLALVGTLLLAGCSWLGGTPSPTTSYTDDSGRTVTVDWADYPAHAGQNGDALIGYADQAELEPTVRRLMEQLSTTLADSSGYELHPTEPEAAWFDDDNWHPQLGNGYGGDSLLTTVNCCELISDEIPDPSRWQKVFDAASQVTQKAGLGPFVRDESSAHCGGADGQCWLWSATATDGVQWVYLSIQDRAQDPTGDAAREADQFDWPLTSIGIGYGATVVQADRADEYARAMEPFIGLKRPEATTSD